MGRATQGVRVMNLAAGEKLVSMARLAERDVAEADARAAVGPRLRLASFRARADSVESRRRPSANRRGATIPARRPAARREDGS